MADNTVLSAAVGVGDTIASDDIAGVKFGRTKITLGADGVNDLDVSSANPMPVTQKPAASGGLTIHRTISAATTNATSVKASAGQLYHLFVSNVNAAARFLKLYNKATAPVVGTDTPVLTYLIPGNTAGAGFSINVPTGLAFSTGIAFALTTGVADADTGAVAANEIVVNIGYS